MIFNGESKNAPLHYRGIVYHRSLENMDILFFCITLAFQILKRTIGLNYRKFSYQIGLKDFDKISVDKAHKMHP